MCEDWLSKELDKDLQKIASEEKPVGWFSVSAVSNIPLISFPGMSQRECEEVLRQSQNVLRISRNENNYKEVAITYSLNNNDINSKYCVVLGDSSAVYIMHDKDTKDLLERENSYNDLVVVSIHNHPNDGNFSLNDLFIFAKNPCIKLMEIVNRKGEVSFLYSSRYIDLGDIVTKNILDVAPDFAERKKKYEDNNETVLRLSDILTPVERKQIIKETLFDYQRRGVYYSEYISKKLEKDIVFDPQTASVGVKLSRAAEYKSLSALNGDTNNEIENALGSEAYIDGEEY